MQALLSRAGQAHRCGCRACGTAANTLGKRVTTARRKPTFAELFTACYSSVFATAALVDAVRKDDRRKDLDRQLEEVRQELADLHGQGASHSPDADSIFSKLDIDQMDALWSTLKTIYSTRPYMKEIHKPATVSKSELIEALKREHYGCPTQDSLKTARQPKYEQLERAIMEEESDSKIYYREPQNKVHLLKESLSTGHLVRKLLDRTKFLPASSPSPSIEEAHALLRKGDQGYTFRSINPKMARNNTILLNERLRSIIHASNLSPRERIGRVCFNLLVSAHPPDMHTYNTLIVAFDKSGYHAFADAIVHSFFYDRLLQPTPITYVAILNHFRSTNNHGKFFTTLACITGADRITGAKIRRRHFEDIEERPSLHRWAADSKRRTWTGKFIWDHVPLTQPLTEEIIQGLLHFKLFDQAARVFIACLRSGVDLSLSLIRQLIDECIDGLDWRGATRLVRGITNSHAKWHRLLQIGETESSLYIAGRVPILLDICGLNTPGRPPSIPLLLNLDISTSNLVSFLQTWGYMRNRWGVDGVSQSKGRLLQIESLLKECDFVQKTTRSIESKLLNAELSLDVRIAMGFYIGDAALKGSLELNREAAELSRQNLNFPGYRLLLESCQGLDTSPSSSSPNQQPLGDTTPGIFGYGKKNQPLSDSGRRSVQFPSWPASFQGENGVLRRVASWIMGTR